jgi:hypothetical protein
MNRNANLKNRRSQTPSNLQNNPEVDANLWKVYPSMKSKSNLKTTLSLFLHQSKNSKKHNPSLKSKRHKMLQIKAISQRLINISGIKQDLFTININIRNPTFLKINQASVHTNQQISRNVGKQNKRKPT